MFKQTLRDVSKDYFGQHKKPDKAQCHYCGYVGDDFILKGWKLDLYCPKCGDKNFTPIYYTDYYSTTLEK